MSALIAMEPSISPMDIEHLRLMRENVERLMACVARQYGDQPGRLLDIASRVHKGAPPFFGLHIEVDTLDIDPDSGAAIIADLCDRAAIGLFTGRYDYGVCTEGLEHVLQSFDAVDNLRELLKAGGLVFVSILLNFRMPGPLPDCRRFTEQGLRHLFRRSEMVELNPLECPDRHLMPIHYTLIARKLEYRGLRRRER